MFVEPGVTRRHADAARPMRTCAQQRGPACRPGGVGRRARR